MILTILTYKKPITEVDKYLTEHIEFLDKFFEQKKFLGAGRRENRIGGAIVVLTDSLEEAKAIMKLDPFYQNDVAEYEFVQFDRQSIQ